MGPYFPAADVVACRQSMMMRQRSAHYLVRPRSCPIVNVSCCRSNHSLIARQSATEVTAPSKPFPPPAVRCCPWVSPVVTVEVVVVVVVAAAAAAAAAVPEVDFLIHLTCHLSPVVRVEREELRDRAVVRVCRCFGDRRGSEASGEELEVWEGYSSEEERLW